MKLLKKYSKEIDEKTSVALTEIINSIRALDKDSIDNVISAYSMKAKSGLSNYSVSKEFDELLELETDKEAINILYSLCQGTETGLVIVGLTAIMSDFSEDTFDYINNAFDFKAYEKEHKLSMSKYFYNKSAKKQQELDEMISIVKDTMKLYKIPTNSYSFLLKNKYYSIASAMKDDFKGKKNNKATIRKMINLSTMLSIVLDEKTYSSVKRYLGLKNPEKLKMEDYDQIVEKLKEKPYRQVDYDSNNSLYKLINILDVENSFIFAVLSGLSTNTLCFEMEHFSTKEIRYFSYELRWGESCFMPVDLSIYDWNNSGDDYFNPVSISIDTSYSAMEKSKNKRGIKYATLDRFVFSNLKSWLRNYSSDNLLGSVVSLNVDYHSNRNDAEVFGIVCNFKYVEDEMITTYLVANVVENEFYFHDVRERHINKIEKLSKYEATIFYQDVQQIYQLESIDRLRDRVENINQRRY